MAKELDRVSIVAASPIRSDRGSTSPPGSVAGRGVTAVVQRLLGSTPAWGFRYEVAALERSFEVLSTRLLAVGERLRVEAPVGDQLILRVLAEPLVPTGVDRSQPTMGVLESGLQHPTLSSGTNTGGEDAARAPEPRPGGIGSTDRQLAGVLARVFQASGLSPSSEAIREWAATIRAEGLDVAAAARAVVQLLAKGLPVLPATLRGGALVEGGAASIDYVGALRSMLEVSASFGEVDRSAFVATGDPAGSSSGLGALRDDHASPGQSRASASGVDGGNADRADRIVSDPLASAAHVAIDSVSPGRARAIAVNLVESVLRADPVLAALRAAIAAVEEAQLREQPAAPELAQRVRDLLRAQPSSLHLIDGAPLETLDRARASLQEMEAQRLREHPALQGLIPWAREVRRRADAASFANWIDGAGLDAEAGPTFAGWARGMAGAEIVLLPFRLRVRDDRRKPNSDLDEVGFRIEVATRGLGRLQVAGQLSVKGDGTASLRLEFRTDVAEAVGRLGKALPELTARLTELGFDPSVTVRQGMPPALDSDPSRAADLSLARAAPLPELEDWLAGLDVRA